MIRKLQPFAAMFVAAGLFLPTLAAAEETVESLIEKAEVDFKIEAEKFKKLQKSLASQGDLDSALATKKESDRVKDAKLSLLSGTTSNSSNSSLPATTGSKTTLGNFYLSGPDHLTIAALQGRSPEMIYVDSIVLEPVD
ncbi:MAG: hypothetical protein ACI8XO_000809 [Verrucomicrobiales bacterium]|jgi:hypothetical protein